MYRSNDAKYDCSIEGIRFYEKKSKYPINDNIEYINRYNLLIIADKYEKSSNYTIKNAFVALAKLVTYNEENINGSLLDNIKKNFYIHEKNSSIVFYSGINFFLLKICKYINAHGLNNNKYDSMYELINDINKINVNGVDYVTDIYNILKKLYDNEKNKIKFISYDIVGTSAEQGSMPLSKILLHPNVTSKDSNYLTAHTEL